MAGQDRAVDVLDRLDLSSAHHSQSKDVQRQGICEFVTQARSAGQQGCATLGSGGDVPVHSVEWFRGTVSLGQQGCATLGSTVFHSVEIA